MRRLATSLPTVFLLAVVLFLLRAPALQGQSAAFKRGDANGDSTLDLSDAVFTLNFLFTGGVESACDDAADANDDGTVDLSDPVYSLLYLFTGGSEPASPGPRCGFDPTEDELQCGTYPPCRDFGDMVTARLQPAEDCADALEGLRDKLTEEMNATLDANLEFALDLARYDWCLWLDGPPSVGPVPVAWRGDAREAEEQGEGDESADEYSGTNNQIEGVDEADFVKNDGGYIYILADGRFQIIDAWPASEAHRIVAADVEGTPKKLFVHKDRAVVYSSLGLVREPPSYPVFDWYPDSRSGECTYGYDCEFTGDGRRLKVTVFDISDRTAPALLREVEFSGSYLSARRIGDLVHTVVVFPKVIVPELVYWPEELEEVMWGWGWGWDFCEEDPFPYSEDEIRAMFEELRQRNAAVIQDASLTDFLPSVRDTRYEGETPQVSEGLLQDCQGFLVPESGDVHGLLSLVSFEITVLEDLEATTVVGKPGAVYASQDSLYIATRHYSRDVGGWYFPSREENPEATTVHKFRLFYDQAGSSYVGSGAVKGRILNQFSMDEYGGYLRIATTTGHVPSPDVHSTVSVLAEEDESLVLVGQVDDIAPTEDIRSVRFSGVTGYLVTFKKTDPLFALDLSDPANPMIRGELKIPGYSTYMHLLDRDHILSIGFDADDQGDFAWFQGILLQIFDVTDIADPRLMHREVIGTRGTTSDAATDHLAFNYFRSRSLLAVPMVICEDGGGGNYGDRMTFNGLLVYRVDLDNGFERLGGVPHVPDTEGANQVHCNSWWTQSNSQVKRSIFMDDYVYSVALDLINVSHLEDLEHPVAGIALGE